MQNLKLFLAVCVTAACVTPLSLRADDTQAQTNSPAPASQETTLSKAELKKQAEADAKARKEAEKAKKKQAEADAKARKEAEKAKKAEEKKQAEAQAKAGQKPAAGQNNPQPKVGNKVPALQPIERPPLPISTDKQQRLQELLQKYRADEVTPEQYQKDRAKILAEP